MDKSKLFLGRKQLIEVKTDLEETLRLVETSLDRFQQKLALLKKEFAEANKSEIQKKIMAKAINLYQDYRRSLKIIENHIDMLSRGIQGSN